MIQTLRERKGDWQSAPGTLQAEDDAEDDAEDGERNDDVGYTTNYKASERSNEELDNDSPVEADSSVISSSDEDLPVVFSDDDLDNPSPDETGSLVYGSDSESDEFDSDSGSEMVQRLG
jgi:hypothetical protein